MRLWAVCTAIPASAGPRRRYLGTIREALNYTLASLSPKAPDGAGRGSLSCPAQHQEHRCTRPAPLRSPGVHASCFGRLMALPRSPPQERLCRCEMTDSRGAQSAGAAPWPRRAGLVGATSRNIVRAFTALGRLRAQFVRAWGGAPRSLGALLHRPRRDGAEPAAQLGSVGLGYTRGCQPRGGGRRGSGARSGAQATTGGEERRLLRQRRGCCPDAQGGPPHDVYARAELQHLQARPRAAVRRSPGPRRLTRPRGATEPGRPWPQRRHCVPGPPHLHRGQAAVPHGLLVPPLPRPHLLPALVFGGPPHLAAVRRGHQHALDGARRAAGPMGGRGALRRHLAVQARLGCVRGTRACA